MSLTRSTVLCELNDFSLVPHCHWHALTMSLGLSAFLFLSLSLPSPFIPCSGKNSSSLPFTFVIKAGQNEL